MTKGTTSGAILFGVCLAVGAVVVLAVAHPIWQPLLIALVLAATLRPIHGWVTARLRGRRTLASSLLVVALALLVLAPLVAIVAFATSEAVSGLKWLQETLHSSRLEGLIAHLPQSMRGYVEQAIDRLPSTAQEYEALAREKGGSAAAVVGGALSAGSRFLLLAVVMLLALHFLLVDGPKLLAWVVRESPLPSQTLRLAHGMGRASRSIVVSLFATAFAQAATATLGYFIGRVPHPLFFGLLTFIAAFIPSVGTAIIALPLAGLMFLLGHPFSAIFLAAWALVIVGLIDNVVKPLLMKGGMELHGAVVFFALIGGITAFGAVGLFVGPLAVAFLIQVVEAGRPEAPALAELEEAHPPDQH